MNKPAIPNDWSVVLKREIDEPYFQALLDTLDRHYAEGPVFPEQSAIFNALNYTSFTNTKVVILGQDPYHGAGQAHGLSSRAAGGEEAALAAKYVQRAA